MEAMSYTEVRANLAAVLNRVIDDREPIIIRRRGADDVALIAADELRSLLETVYLFASPANGIRLLTAMERAQSGTLPPTDLTELRERFDLYEEASPRAARRRPAS